MSILLRDKAKYPTIYSQLEPLDLEHPVALVMPSVAYANDIKEEVPDGWHLFTPHMIRKDRRIMEGFNSVVFYDPVYYLANNASLVNKVVLAIMKSYVKTTVKVVALMSCPGSSIPEYLINTFSSIFPKIVPRRFSFKWRSTRGFPVSELEMQRKYVFNYNVRPSLEWVVSDNQHNLDVIISVVNRHNITS